MTASSRTKTGESNDFSCYFSSVLGKSRRKCCCVCVFLRKDIKWKVMMVIVVVLLVAVVVKECTRIPPSTKINEYKWYALPLQPYMYVCVHCEM